MKRFFICALIAAASITAGSASAQTSSQLPVDSKVRIGKLENGLTYYIRKNETNKQRADFYIAQKVGSVLENESQLGLAHFLEHMAFGGSKNFPSGQLIKYLETIGVKFGENLNAYTAFDETVYNISNVPLIRSTIIDSALLVLHDWSSFVSLEGQGIEKERGVIREEWRTRNTGQFRVMCSLVKDIFPNNILSNRMPIGSIDIINTFSHQEIRDYYKKWYRPDLQAIIIVGDINVDDIEKRIKTIFADIAKPQNPATRTYQQVEDNKEPIVAIATDPEFTASYVSLMFKKDAVAFDRKNTREYYMNNIGQSLITRMMNARLQEIARQSNPPFIGASSSFGKFSVALTKDAWSTNAAVKTGQSLNALRAIARENERMHRFGFNAAELERVKVEVLRSYESYYNEKDKQKNESYVKEYVSHFTVGEPIPGVDYEYEMVKKELPLLSIDVINKMAKELVTDHNMVINVSGPKKDDVYTPTKAEILAAIDEVKKENITAYEYKVVDKPLLSAKPTAGKVVKVEAAPLGYTKWTLSNGAMVYLKKTDYKKDQVIMTAFSKGGTSLFDAKEKHNYSIINEVATLGGIGEFNNDDLRKVLSGKLAGVKASVGGTGESMSGNASPRDFETLMQLTYLYFTQPRADKQEFDNYIAKKKNALITAALNPANAYGDSLRATLYGHNPLVSSYTVEMLEKADYNRIIEMYKERFANAGDFTFLFTGNIDFDMVKPFIETYIGGLPSQKGTEKWKDNGLRMVKGKVTNEFAKDLSVPKTTVFVNYSGKAKYSAETDVLMNFVQAILNFRFTEVIRMQEGGTYGVSVRGSISKIPSPNYSLQISFDTDPKLKARLLELIHQEISALVKNGPSAVDVNKVKEFSMKKFQEMQVENGYWANMMQSYLNDGVDYTSTYAKIVEGVTPEQVQKVAKQWLTQGNVVEVIMNPTPTK